MPELYEDRDKSYAAERNRLIPLAVAYANKAHRVRFPGGPQKAREAWAGKWNLAFHSKMDSLWAERTATNESN